MATEPAATPSHGPFEACSLVLMGEGGKRPYHMVLYVAGRSALQEGLAVKGRIVSVGLINASVIRGIFFVTGLGTLRHTAPGPGRANNPDSSRFT